MPSPRRRRDRELRRRPRRRETPDMRPTSVTPNGGQGQAFPPPSGPPSAPPSLPKPSGGGKPLPPPKVPRAPKPGGGSPLPPPKPPRPSTPTKPKPVKPATPAAPTKKGTKLGKFLRGVGKKLQGKKK